MATLFGNYGLTPERGGLFMYFGLASLAAALPGALAWFAFVILRPATTWRRD
jgi:hypothetical protein